MGTLFFCFVALLLAGYVALDGYDLGAGILHLRVARDDAERRQVLATIGPLWDGNEVYLVAAGGTLFFAFPLLYAVSFSGFYLPLMIALWLLMGRGVAIELRNHLEAAPWRQFFDAVFSLSSGLLGFFLGVALGNVVRGVPLGSDRVFLQPLWSGVGAGQAAGGAAGVIDPYTALVGATAFAVLAEHGALWIAHRTEGPVRERARALAPRLWAISLALTVGTSVATFFVQPHIPQAMAAGPWRAAFPAAAVLACLGAPLLHLRGRDGAAFAAWSAFLALLLATAAFGLYPWVLPSSIDPALSLTVEQAQAADASLRTGAAWWVPGVALGIGYTVYVHRCFSGRVPRG
ncbi:MAG TPA: cytochrome d ubiquinol oxidase subunit II [Anaeromyxobacteraceae bacterium]|nr:cytochrome d ubiquinol oxidase subunit II [Anaeromyxobacteraceae bacterium]